MRRAFVVVIDACGAGELPDAADYGDAGSNTLVHLAEAVGGLRLPTLQRLGLGSIMPIEGVAPARGTRDPRAARRAGPGQGVRPPATGSSWARSRTSGCRRTRTGFPPDVVAELERVTGHTFLCNRPYNGIAVIEALRRGAPPHRRAHPLHVAGLRAADRRAHERPLARRELVDVCRAAREVMRGEHAVGPRHRPAVRRRAGLLAAHRGPQGPLAGAAGAVLPRRARRAAASRSTRSARSATSSRASGSASRHPGATNAIALASTTALDRRAGARPGVHEPRRDRPGVRAPQGRRGLPPGPAR